LNRREAGFLLLTSHLGDPLRRPLTVAQLRNLAKRVQQMVRPGEERDVTQADLVALGYDRATADRILLLMSQEEQLDWYLQKGKRVDCVPVTRVSDDYPDRLRRNLGLDCPGCLWAKGDISILHRPGVALVGSRDLGVLNAAFAAEAGEQAAKQGFALISGNARGADSVAQEACLNGGGYVVSVVADRLEEHPYQEHVLYLSEDGFDLPFSTQRALSRNRVIHSLGLLTVIAQCTLAKGGTWDGTTRNLRKGWSPVFCMDDGSEASRELEMLGAALICGRELSDYAALIQSTIGFINK